MRKTQRNLIIIGAACVGLVAIAGVFQGPRDDASAYSWDAIRRGEIREILSASGEIRARTQISVGTSVLGEIRQLHVVDGQDVKAGDTLVTIDQERLWQALVQGTAALESARKELERLHAARARAEETFKRTESLHAQGLLSDEEYRADRFAVESARISAAAAESTVTQNEAAVAGLRDGLSKSVLRAPISGKVTSLKAEKGETAIPGTSNLPGATLMVISDMSEMVAEIGLNESEVVRARVGQIAQVAVESLPGKVFQGRVSEIATGAESNPSQGTIYRVKVLLNGRHPDLALLRPGMAARAVILTAEAKNILRVPLQAVLEREGTVDEARRKGLLLPAPHLAVMVYGNGRAQETRVDVGIANTQFYELKSGLKEGDRVLTGPSKKLKELKDDAPVKLRGRSDEELANRSEAPES